MMLESVPPYLFFLSLLEMVLNYCTSLKFAFKIFINHFFEEDYHTVRTSNLNSDCASGGWSFASIHSLHDNTVGGLDLVVQTGVQS